MVQEFLKAGISLNDSTVNLRYMDIVIEISNLDEAI
jgi:hypothetical protein